MSGVPMEAAVPRCGDHGDPGCSALVAVAGRTERLEARARDLEARYDADQRMKMGQLVVAVLSLIGIVISLLRG